METITVIIPVYNAEQHIKQCIESAINQTYRDLEILIIIDGGTDKSKVIADEYARRDSRIKIIDRENKGIFFTRIEGIEKSTSKNIYFLDADDWIEEDTIKTMYQYKNKYKCDIVRCKNYYIDENKKYGQANKNEIILKENFNQKLYPQLFGSYQYASIWNQLVSKDCYQKIEYNDYNISYGEDYLLNLNIYKNIKSIALIPEYLYHYRTNENSITNKQDYESLLQKLNSTLKSHIQVIEYVDKYDEIKNNKQYKKTAIYRMIRGLKNSIIQYAQFGIKCKKQEEVYKELERLLNANELKDISKEITLKEVLMLANKESHKYVIKNIYNKKTKKIINYIKMIYIPGKKIKNMIRR